MSDKLYHECQEIVAQGKALLEDLAGWGFETVSARSSAAAPESDLTTTATTLAALQEAVGDCQRCALGSQRNRLVFGAGHPQADLVLVGEAPGREEDRQGVPFVGEAGQLLERILFAMNLTREQVYICNVIKCRPPQNRDPQDEEIATCEPFLKRQLELIRPRLIVALGRFSAQTLLQTKEPISRLRGHWHEYAGIPLMPTYHPAYLLRNPASKREVWEDMKQVMRRLK